MHPAQKSLTYAPEQIERMLDRVLLRVDRPGRYVGGEYNSIVKDWNTVDFRVALAFADIYDLGMSNLGIMILYEQINKQQDMLAERVFSVWDDMEQLMRAEGIPLYSLENKRSIREFEGEIVLFGIGNVITIVQQFNLKFRAGTGFAPLC